MFDRRQTSARWASVLGVAAVSEGDSAVVLLEAAGQSLRFVPAGAEGSEGIVEVSFAVDSTDPVPALAHIGGVRFATARMGGYPPVGKL